jgi:hypothetical protein
MKWCGHGRFGEECGTMSETKEGGPLGLVSWRVSAPIWSAGTLVYEFMSLCSASIAAPELPDLHVHV